MLEEWNGPAAALPEEVWIHRAVERQCCAATGCAGSALRRRERGLWRALPAGEPAGAPPALARPRSRGAGGRLPGALGRHGGRSARDPQGRRRLRAARSRPTRGSGWRSSSGTPSCWRPCSPWLTLFGGAEPLPPASACGRCCSTPTADHRRRERRGPGAARAARRPGVPDLHLGLDRHAQGGHGQPRQRGQLLRRHGRASGSRAGLLAGGHQHLLRHLGPRAAVDAGARLPGGGPASREALAALPCFHPAPGPPMQFSLFYFASDERAGRGPNTGCCWRGAVRGPARLRRGVDPGAPLPRLRRPLSQPVGHRRGARRGDRAGGDPRGQRGAAAPPPGAGGRGVVGGGQPLGRPGGALVRFGLERRGLRVRAGELRRAQGGACESHLEAVRGCGAARRCASRAAPAKRSRSASCRARCSPSCRCG